MAGPGDEVAAAGGRGGGDLRASHADREDVRIGARVIIAAASVAAAILLWHPDNGLAFMAFLIAAVTLLVAPIVTVGVMVDVRRHKRSGGQLPPWPAPGVGGTPSQHPASAAPAEPLPPIDRGQQHTAEAARSDLARRRSPGWRLRVPLLARSALETQAAG